ncbi:MAG: siderophore-interacting protein [Bacteroidota bacterium]
MLTVVEKKQVTLNMLRITLQGDQLENISWKPGCYIKLSIPNGEKRKMRTYTARSYDSVRKTLDVDFAIHQPAGPATRWALDAEIGDVIEIRGPGHLKMDMTKGDWYLFAADMAALPAAISAIESLPSHAKGYAFLEITDEQDKQEFSSPSGLEIQWLIHPHPKEKSTQQLASLQSIEPLAGTPNIFVAGELSTIREIKAYIKGEAKYKNASTYISSYWKIGVSEEKHKLAKMMMR